MVRRRAAPFTCARPRSFSNGKLAIELPPPAPLPPTVAVQVPVPVPAAFLDPRRWECGELKWTQDWRP